MDYIRDLPALLQHLVHRGEILVLVDIPLLGEVPAVAYVKQFLHFFDLLYVRTRWSKIR